MHFVKNHFKFFSLFMVTKEKPVQDLNFLLFINKDFSNFQGAFLFISKQSEIHENTGESSDRAACFIIFFDRIESRENRIGIFFSFSSKQQMFAADSL